MDLPQKRIGLQGPKRLRFQQRVQRFMNNFEDQPCVRAILP